MSPQSPEALRVAGHENELVLVLREFPGEFFADAGGGAGDQGGGHEGSCREGGDCNGSEDEE